MTKDSTTCSGLSCFGSRWTGHLLKCPSCGSSLVLYTYAKPARVAVKVAA